MPCACRSKGIRHQKVITPTKQQKTVQQVLKTVPTQEVQYDFTSTVKPQDFCTNCALKHIALAITLLDQDTQMNKWLAAAQIYLAGLHYKQKSSNLFNICLMVSKKIILETQQTEVSLKRLLNFALNSAIKHKFGALMQEVINIEFLKARLLQSCLLIHTVYSLLFLQITYEQLNRPYAIGHLEKASMQLAKYHQTYKLRSQLRKLWKIIQQAKDFNKDVLEHLQKAMEISRDFYEYSTQHTEEQTLAYIKQKSEDFNIK